MGFDSHKPLKYLRNWRIAYHYVKEESSPEVPRMFLEGDACTTPNGIAVRTRTSMVQDLDLTQRLAETCNTRYALVGQPDAEWIEEAKKSGYWDSLNTLINTDWNRVFFRPRLWW